MVVAQTSEATKSLANFAHSLHTGRVYRREDLTKLSNAVDRHLRKLLDSGGLKKLAQGLYYSPRESHFGPLPPNDRELVAAFLRDEHFLIFSPSSYNSLGLGTTQLYNATYVYNHKRHGRFTFGNRTFDFRVKSRFPENVSEEFLFVDLLNNVDEIAEDKVAVLGLAQRNKTLLNSVEFQRALQAYGSVATKKMVSGW